MGVHVILDVLWGSIQPAAWSEAYDETLALLRAHPARLMGYAWRPVLGRTVAMYTKDIEQSEQGERHWSVVGDRRSMRFAEGFDLPRAHPGPPAHRPRRGGAEDADLALHDPFDRRGARLFGGKTRGEPYHLPIVAAGLVVEARFPGAALLYGDIDEGDARDARRWAGEVLGRELPLPVLFDAPALLRRLARRWTGEALLDAFARRFRGDAGRGLACALAAVEPPAADAFLKKHLARRHRRGGGPDLDGWIQGFLLATGDAARLCALAGAAMPPEAMASALAAAGVLLSPALRRRAAQCRAMPLPSRPDMSSVGALVGAIFVNRDWSAPALDEGALERAFSVAYPGQAAALLARVREETRALEEALARMCDAIEQGERFQAGLEPYQDVGELAALRSADQLAPSTRRRLAAFACALARAKDVAGRDGSEARGTVAMRTLIAQVGSERGPTLTEHAWRWILREDDPALLGLLPDLLCCQPGSDEGARLRRALLESRVLCAELARILGDEAAMAEGRALVEAARRDAAERRATRTGGG